MITRTASLRIEVARALFEEARHQQTERDPVRRIDRVPVAVLTWETCEQDPWLRLADAVLDLPSFARHARRAASALEVV